MRAKSIAWRNGIIIIRASFPYLDRIRYTMVKNQVQDVDNDTYNQIMDMPWATADQPEYLRVSNQCNMFSAYLPHVL